MKELLRDSQCDDIDDSRSVNQVGKPKSQHKFVMLEGISSSSVQAATTNSANGKVVSRKDDGWCERNVLSTTCQRREATLAKPATTAKTLTTSTQHRTTSTNSVDLESTMTSPATKNAVVIPSPPVPYRITANRSHHNSTPTPATTASRLEHNPNDQRRHHASYNHSLAMRTTDASYHYDRMGNHCNNHDPSHCNDAYNRRMQAIYPQSQASIANSNGYSSELDIRRNRIMAGRGSTESSHYYNHHQQHHHNITGYNTMMYNPNNMSTVEYSGENATERKANPTGHLTTASMMMDTSILHNKLTRMTSSPTSTSILLSSTLSFHQYESIGDPRLEIYKARLPPRLLNLLDTIVMRSEIYAANQPTGWHTDLYSLTRQDLALCDIPGMSQFIQPIVHTIHSAMMHLYGGSDSVRRKHDPNLDAMNSYDMDDDDEHPNYDEEHNQQHNSAHHGNHQGIRSRNTRGTKPIRDRRRSKRFHRQKNHTNDRRCRQNDHGSGGAMTVIEMDKNQPHILKYSKSSGHTGGKSKSFMWQTAFLLLPFFCTYHLLFCC